MMIESEDEGTTPELQLEAVAQAVLVPPVHLITHVVTVIVFVAAV